MAGTILAAIPTNALNGDVALKSDGTSGVRSDTLALKRMAVGFMVNAAGNVTFITGKNDSVTLTPAAGVPIGLQIRQVMDTGTTVTNANIVLFYTDI